MGHGLGRASLWWLGFLTVGALGACTSRPDAVPVSSPDAIPIYVVTRGWHSGVALPARSVSSEMLPERADHPDAAYLEFGWGDRDFYRASDYSFWLMLKAGLWSEESVLFIDPLPVDPHLHDPCSSLLVVTMPPENFRRLLGYIRDTVRRRNSSAKTDALPSTDVRRGYFYPANGHFHAFNTCNTWTWHALAAAGYPVAPPRPITATGLIDRTIFFGQWLPSSPSCHAD